MNLQEIKSDVAALPDAVDKDFVYRNMLTTGIKAKAKWAKLTIEQLEAIYQILGN